MRPVAQAVRQGVEDQLLLDLGDRRADEGARRTLGGLGGVFDVEDLGCYVAGAAATGVVEALRQRWARA